MDIAAFTLVLVASIWLFEPLTRAPGLLTWTALAGIAIAVGSVVWHRYSPARLGIRIDNLLPAVAVFVPLSLLYAAAAILVCGGFTPQPQAHPWYRGIPWRLTWSFLQEFCLLSFILNRFLDLLHRSAAAVLAASVLFALLHLPNPFLTLYTLGGGLILTLVFLRFPNLFAATLAHTLASLMASLFIPGAVTGSMRVGPLYWSAPWVH